MCVGVWLSVQGVHACVRKIHACWLEDSYPQTRPPSTHLVVLALERAHLVQRRHDVHLALAVQRTVLQRLHRVAHLLFLTRLLGLHLGLRALRACSLGRYVRGARGLVRCRGAWGWHRVELQAQEPALASSCTCCMQNPLCMPLQIMNRRGWLTTCT